MAPPASPPRRRMTRSSLSRFAYSDGGSTTRDTIAAPGMDIDIEDAVPDTSSRKRKRTATRTKLSSTAAKSSTSNRPAQTVKTEEQEAKVEETKSKSSSSTPKRQPRRPARQATDARTGTTTTTAPSDWEEIYDTVKTMRLTGAAANAAVDTMGCERLADTAASPRDQRFQTLVALMLSSQTKDTTNAVAMRRLKTELPAHAPGAPAGLNLENMLAVEAEMLNRLIWAVGFHNNKTRYLQQAAAVCRDRWDGDIPDSIAGLVALPGVGPKMAHLCLSAAWGRTEGIGVDVHVHRITNLWGWHGKETKNPEQTRAGLESWLPRDRWREINWLLVGLGQTVCLPVGRRCGECEVGLKGLCRAAEQKKVVEGRRVRESRRMAMVVETGGEEGDGNVLVKEEEEEKEKVVEVERDVVVNEEVEEGMYGKDEELAEEKEPRVKLEEVDDTAPSPNTANSKRRKAKKG